MTGVFIFKPVPAASVPLARACHIRTSRRPTARQSSRLRRSTRRLSSSGRPGSPWFDLNRSAANAWMSVSGIHGAPRLASMSPGSTSSGWTARRASTLRAYSAPALSATASLPAHCPTDRRRRSASVLDSGSWKIRSPSSAMISSFGLAVERGDEGQIDRAVWFRETSNPSSALVT